MAIVFTVPNVAAAATATAAVAVAAAARPRRAPSSKLAPRVPHLKISVVFRRFGRFGHFRAFSDVLGRFRAFSSVFGRFRAFSDVFGCIGPIFRYVLF